MKILNLKDRPDLCESTLRLIENSFKYRSPNSFEIDFAPLIDKSNHRNCFILVDEKESVVAHIGAKEKNLILHNENFPVILLGGIAVDETRRGEGHFQTLFQDVLAEKRSDTALFILWSDLEKLYNKFGFHLCGSQFEVTGEKTQSPYVKTTLASLHEDERKQIEKLYSESFAKEYLTFERDKHDWDLLSKITSADLFLQKHNGRIESYYFQNKGQDLPGIIHEYGSKKDISAFISEISSYGTLWTGKEILPTEHYQYQFFMSPGDTRLFSQLISKLTNDQFSIRDINVMKQEVFFDYNEETLSLDLPEFLRGVFGPGVFEEISVPSLFISGLDSI